MKCKVCKSPITKIVRIGTMLIDKRWGSIYCSITIEKGNLSISGVIAPLPSGNCLGSCGQIKDTIVNANIRFTKGWDIKKFTAFIMIWEKWHLNDLTAGTPKQEKAVDEWQKTHKYDYTKICKYLKAHHLYTDKGYEYGTSWLKTELPEKVAKFLQSLPDTDKKPAWL